MGVQLRTIVLFNPYPLSPTPTPPPPHLFFFPQRVVYRFFPRHQKIRRLDRQWAVWPIKKRENVVTKCFIYGLSYVKKCRNCKNYRLLFCGMPEKRHCHQYIYFTRHSVSAPFVTQPFGIDNIFLQQAVCHDRRRNTAHLWVPSLGDGPHHSPIHNFWPRHSHVQRILYCSSFKATFTMSYDEAAGHIYISTLYISVFNETMSKHIPKKKKKYHLFFF